MRRLNDKSDSTSSVEVVDDDSLAWSERSEDRHLLKLSVFSNDVFSHNRVINPSQIADEEDQGRPSYPLLVNLIKRSSHHFVQSSDCKLEGELVVWCTYQDRDDQSVLIASSEELRYAFKGTCDTLPLKVTILQKGTTGSKSTTTATETKEEKVPPPFYSSLEESKLRTILQTNNQRTFSYLRGMEDRIQQAMTNTLGSMEFRLEEKMEQLLDRSIDRAVDLLQERQGKLELEEEEEKNTDEEFPKASKRLPADVLAQAILPGDNTMDLMEQGLVADAHVTASATTCSSDLLPLVNATTDLEIPTADCQWVVPLGTTTTTSSNNRAPAADQPPSEENKSTNNEGDIMEAFFGFLERNSNHEQVDEAMVKRFFQGSAGSSNEFDPPASSSAGGLGAVSTTSAEDTATEAAATTPTRDCDEEEPNEDGATLDDLREILQVASEAANNFATAYQESNEDTNRRLDELKNEVTKRLDGPLFQHTLKHIATHKRLDELTNAVSKRLDGTMLQHSLKQIESQSRKHTKELDRLQTALEDSTSRAATQNQTTATKLKDLSYIVDGIPTRIAQSNTLQQLESHGKRHTKGLDRLRASLEDSTSRATAHNQTTVLRLHALADTVHALQTNNARALSSLKEDVEATSKQMEEWNNTVHARGLSRKQMEEWNKTVLGGISSLTKVLHKRLNDRTDKIVRRIAQLEACCSDLSQKSTSEKQWRALEKVQAEQTKLRQDIKTLIKALVKEANKEDDGEGSSSTSSSSGSCSSLEGSDSSQSSSGSVYITTNVARGRVYRGAISGTKEGSYDPQEEGSYESSGEEEGSYHSDDEEGSWWSGEEDREMNKRKRKKKEKEEGSYDSGEEEESYESGEDNKDMNKKSKMKKEDTTDDKTTHRRTSVRWKEETKNEESSEKKKNIKEKAVHRLEGMNRAAVRGSVRRPSQSTGLWHLKSPPPSRTVETTDSLILYGLEQSGDDNSSICDGLWKKKCEAKTDKPEWISVGNKNRREKWEKAVHRLNGMEREAQRLKDEQEKKKEAAALVALRAAAGGREWVRPHRRASGGAGARKDKPKRISVAKRTEEELDDIDLYRFTEDEIEELV